VVSVVSCSFIIHAYMSDSLTFGQNEIFGSAYAAAVYLSSVVKFPKDKKVYVIGMKGLEEELAEEGISYLGGTVCFKPHVSNTYR
jgi:ribonucleotide monophosphatase NagD (HAD superfamily)